MAYQPRIVDNKLDELLPGLAAISVEGPRGVGKTSTALQRVDHVIRLDDPDQRQVIEADPRLLEPGEGSILIDEWQRFPYSWDYVRRAVDNHAPAGRFLMTGSATPKKAPAHTGAGRIVSLRMRPLTLAERGVAQPTVSLQALLSGTVPEISGTTDMGVAGYVAEIIGSGLPGIRSLPPRQQRTQLEGYPSSPSPTRWWMQANSSEPPMVYAVGFRHTRRLRQVPRPTTFCWIQPHQESQKNLHDPHRRLIAMR